MNRFEMNGLIAGFKENVLMNFRKAVKNG